MKKVINMSMEIDERIRLKILPVNVSFTDEAEDIIRVFFPVKRIDWKDARDTAHDCNNQCAYCGSSVFVWPDSDDGYAWLASLVNDNYSPWDYVHSPESLGPSCYGNVTLICPNCREEKKDDTPSVFLRKIYDDPDHDTRFESLQEALDFFETHYDDVLKRKFSSYPDWMNVVLNDRPADLSVLLKIMVKYDFLTARDGRTAMTGDWESRPDAPIVRAYLEAVQTSDKKLKKYAFLSAEEVVEGIPEDWVIQQDGSLQLAMEPDEIEQVFLRRMVDAAATRTKRNNSYQTKVTGSLNLFLAKAHEIINDGDNGLYQLPSSELSRIRDLCVDGDRVQDQWIPIAKTLLAASGNEIRNAVGIYGKIKEDASVYQRVIDGMEKNKRNEVWSFPTLLSKVTIPRMGRTWDAEWYEDELNYHWDDDGFLDDFVFLLVKNLLIVDGSSCRLVSYKDPKRNQATTALKTALLIKNHVVKARGGEDGVREWTESLREKVNEALRNCCGNERALNALKLDLQNLKYFRELLSLSPSVVLF